MIGDIINTWDFRNIVERETGQATFPIILNESRNYSESIDRNKTIFL